MTQPSQDDQGPAVEVRECGEPLVDLRHQEALLVDPAVAAALVRVGVADRLVTAQTLLPIGMRLLVVSGRCPVWLHHTGAAADLRMCTGDGATVVMDAATAARLGAALVAAGLVGDPDRPWHWSYGDLAWARHRGAAYTRYGPVADLAGPGV
ncbi:D-alanyl-D-alanine dipeptidase [Catellatospora sp. TT07R-123]|uniref:hypothetical protein n=1 Tax=Catellatospora sp. TT07R-123 TaxID=2733863 RepID=UPI001B15A0EE|nr:hypothetical protein [Catellatospora sp. TT07R-123]GHJ43598.1 D-alanyl-D-alanine dipeptidase [Catellatospora sp. TT07R-123]